MIKRILVVEDEIEIGEGIKNFLEHAGYQVEVAADGLEGAYLAQNEGYDLILLDVMLPKMDGYTVLEMIRKASEVPVILLTALEAVEDQIKGFDLQADDYITKPFDSNLVLKRIEAVLRRERVDENASFSKKLSHEEITMDQGSYEVFLSGAKIALTHTEYELLQLFLAHPNRVFTRDELLDACWGENFFGSDHLVNVHVGNLRKKIGDGYIQTVRGRGYKLAVNDEN